VQITKRKHIVLDTNETKGYDLESGVRLGMMLRELWERGGKDRK
jgi:hypothetical protein